MTVTTPAPMPADSVRTATRMETRTIARALAQVYASTLARLAAEETAEALPPEEACAVAAPRTVLLPSIDGLLDALGETMRAQGKVLRVLDRDTLAASLARLETAVAYEGDIAALAAGLFEGLAVRHPLQDGNKRLACLAVLTFCALNSCDIDADPDRLFAAVSGVIARRHGTDSLQAVLAGAVNPGALARTRAAWGAAWAAENAEALAAHAAWVETHGLPLDTWRMR